MHDQVTDSHTDRALWLWLFLAGLAGSLVGVPYTVAVLMDPAAGGPVDPRGAWLSAVAEAFFFLAPASAVGVWLGKRVGLGPRRLREGLTESPTAWKELRASLLTPILAGLTLGVLGLSQHSLPAGALGAGMDNPNTFEHFLRCISAALTEEILFRLGLLTLLVWGIRSIVKKRTIDALSLLIANVLVAPLFAAAHLPHMLAFGSLNLGMVTLIVLFSCSASIVMGWVYIRYGLIAAVVAHLVADMTVYVMPKVLGLSL